MKKHLAIFSKTGIEALFSGHKTIESRFSRDRISPFGQVDTDDLVYVKPSGEEIVGQFKVAKIISYAGMDTADLDHIRAQYGAGISFGSAEEDTKYFKSHANARYCTLIFIKELERFLTPPVKIAKKDLRGWAVLD
jgi:predicted transcriptional regulator